MKKDEQELINEYCYEAGIDVNSLTDQQKESIIYTCMTGNLTPFTNQVLLDIKNKNKNTTT